MAETIELNIVAKLDELAKNLSEAQGLNAEAAQKMYGDLLKSHKQAVMASNKLSKSMSTAAKKDLEDIKKGAEKVFGGIVGDVGDVADAFVAMGLTGTVAVGALAGAAGFAGIVASLGAVGQAGLDAAKRLKELGATDAITPGQQMALDDMKESLDRMDVATASASVSFSTLFAPAIKYASNSLTGLSQGLDYALTAVADMDKGTRDWLVWLGDKGVKMILWPATAVMQFVRAIAVLDEALGNNGGAAREAVKAYDDMTTSVVEWGLSGLDASATWEGPIQQSKEAKEAADKLKEATDKQTAAAYRSSDGFKAEAEAAKAAADYLEEVAKAEQEVLNSRGQSWLQYAKDQEAATALEAKNHQTVLALWDEAVAAQHELEDAQAAAADSGLSNMDKLKGALGQVWAAYDAVTGAVQDLFAASDAQHQGKLDALRAERKELVESMKTMSKTEREKAQIDLDGINTRAKNEKKALEKSFKAQQKLAMAMAVVDAARAAVTLIPSFAFLGPGAPFAAAATAAAGLLTQMAVIKAEKPKFHTGGSPDEIAATLTRGEAVVNPRGVAALGGSKAIEQINRGTPPSGPRGAEAPVVIAFDGEIMDMLVSKGLRSRSRAAIAAMPRVTSVGNRRI